MPGGRRSASIRNNASGRGIGEDSRSMTSRQRAAAGLRRGWASWTARRRSGLTRGPSATRSCAAAGSASPCSVSSLRSRASALASSSSVRVRAWTSRRSRSAAGRLPPGRPHLTTELTGYQIASARDRVPSIPLPGGARYSSALAAKRGWPVGQAFDHHRDGLTIVGVGERQRCLQPDGGVGVGQQGPNDLPGGMAASFAQRPRRGRAA